MPVVFPSEDALVRVQERLNAANVFPRRYFRPSLNEVPAIHTEQACPVSEALSRCILALPSYDELPLAHVDQIAMLIAEVLDGHSGS